MATATLDTPVVTTRVTTTTVRRRRDSGITRFQRKMRRRTRRWNRSIQGAARNTTRSTKRVARTTAVTTKRVAKKPVPMVVRGSRSLGRSARSIARATWRSLAWVSGIVVRAFGYAGRAVTWAVGSVLSLVGAAAAATGMAGLAVVLLALVLIGGLFFLVHRYVSPFFLWTSRGRGSYAQARREQRIKDEARVDRMTEKVAARLGMDEVVTDFDATTGAWSQPGDIVVEKEEVVVEEPLDPESDRTVLVDLEGEELVLEDAQMQIFAHADSEPLTIDWALYPVDADVIEVMKAVLANAETPEIGGIYLGRLKAAELYLSHPDDWEARAQKTKALIITQRRNQQDKYPVKHVRSGFDAQVRDIKAQLAVTS